MRGELGAYFWAGGTKWKGLLPTTQPGGSRETSRRLKAVEKRGSAQRAPGQPGPQPSSSAAVTSQTRLLGFPFCGRGVSTQEEQGRRGAGELRLINMPDV